MLVNRGKSIRAGKAMDDDFDKLKTDARAMPTHDRRKRDLKIEDEHSESIAASPGPYYSLEIMRVHRVGRMG